MRQVTLEPLFWDIGQDECNEGGGSCGEDGGGELGFGEQRAAQARTLATEAVVAARAAEARLCCYFGKANSVSLQRKEGELHQQATSTTWVATS